MAAQGACRGWQQVGPVMDRRQRRQVAGGGKRRQGTQSCRRCGCCYSAESKIGLRLSEQIHGSPGASEPRGHCRAPCTVRQLGRWPCSSFVCDLSTPGEPPKSALAAAKLNAPPCCPAPARAACKGPGVLHSQSTLDPHCPAHQPTAVDAMAMSSRGSVVATGSKQSAFLSTNFRSAVAGAQGLDRARRECRSFLPPDRRCLGRPHAAHGKGESSSRDRQAWPASSQAPLHPAPPPPAASPAAGRQARTVRAAPRPAGRNLGPVAEANLFGRVARIFKSYANAAGAVGRLLCHRSMLVFSVLFACPAAAMGLLCSRRCCRPCHCCREHWPVGAGTHPACKRACCLLSRQQHMTSSPHSTCTHLHQPAPTLLCSERG